jgi:hypothetical protein
MSSYLNQTFYQPIVFDKKELFALLDPFIYSEHSCINKSFLKETQEQEQMQREKEQREQMQKEKEQMQKEKEQEQKRQQMQREQIQKEKEPHSFFWCLYIIHYGIRSFMEIGNKYGNVECDEKLKIVNDMKENPSKLKEMNQRITKSKQQEIMSELLTSTQLSISTLSVICAYYAVNVYIVIPKTNIYYYISSKMAEKTCILYKSNRGKYIMDIEINDEKTEHIKNTMVLLESPEKPFKSLSSYKLNELMDIAIRLKLTEENTKQKKSELYERICKIDTKI